MTRRGIEKNWDATESYLNLIASRGIKPGLERIQRLMDLLNHPERKFKSIHVAGTNGKGSVCAMLESILRAAGIKTGLYISPHLNDVRERISVSGEQIGYESLSFWIKEIRERAGTMEPELTYFELLTAAAFCYFAEMKVELAVVEVGLGGRLDATNILSAPEICVITNITLEHTEYLGKTIPKVAREKAGIIKKDSVCVTGATDSALKVIKEICRQHDSRLIAVETPVGDIFEQFETFEQFSADKIYEYCALKGDFQKKNLTVVLSVVQTLKKNGWAISNDHVICGLKNVHWPGRFDLRVFRTGSKDVPILLDGAHNPAAVKELVGSIGKTELADKKCLLIFNALRDKKLDTMVHDFMKGLNVNRIFIPFLNTSRSSVPDFVKSIFKKNQNKVSIETFESVRKMWSELCNQRETVEEEWILLTGSFYLVGETLNAVSQNMDSSIPENLMNVAVGH